MISRADRLRITIFLLLLTCCALSQPASVELRPRFLPQDTGAPGLDQALRKLKTTARLLQTTAHPDDEDGGTLTMQARGRGAEVMLMSLTRGDGGQNKTGSNLFDELGVLRTLELLEAARYYGVDVRFSRVADFGYSKTAEETFQKWGGHEIALADMVRVIREFRPDVVASDWSGTPSDGHGHHQASGILTPEAVQAAADPSRFPEQIKEGLLPWQVKKLYIRTRSSEDYTVRFETGKVDPDLGTSYAQIGIEGYSHQKSQNASLFSARPGPNYRMYKLVQSVFSNRPDVDKREEDFFDGIDTTLTGLVSRLGKEESQVLFLLPALKEIEANVDQTVATRSPEPLLAAGEELNKLIPQVEQSHLSVATKQDLLLNLRTKSREFEDASRLALGLNFQVSRDVPLQLLVPGQSVRLTARLQNNGKRQITVKQIALDLPEGWQQKTAPESAKMLSPGESASVEFTVAVPANAEITRPYWHRNEPDKENIFTIDDPRYQTLPLPPPPVRAHVAYEFSGKAGVVHTNASAQVNGKDTDLTVVPAFSVLMQHATAVIPAGKKSAMDEDVIVRSNLSTPAEAIVRLQVPGGWHANPASQKVVFNKAGEEKTAHFELEPEAPSETRTQISAELEYKGRKYDEGFSVVTRDDIAAFYYYQPSIQKISVVKVALPENLKIGYIEGAGDDILPSLQQLGLNARLVSPDELKSGDLNQYGAIVLGIRAYDTCEDVRKYNQRLLDFVSQGGTLLVQNNFDVDTFNAGRYTPYAAQLGRQRVSVEEAPVEMLAPQDAIFNFPNKITAHDFDGWIQERGINFMAQWDDKFQPLLASGDPGETPLKGGLLQARVGKGTYIYTGYAFFRQFPAGVPGAIRLYVNILSAGHQP
ncbi:MAG TPA: NEW3 domain-containing protein [Terriglobales bacterium]|nr:NEW3 domain-containing protein [Terriglobales bacterium]